MATELIPERPTLDDLRAAAAGCKACPLWEGTTQTVFGEERRRLTEDLTVAAGALDG